MAELFRRFLGPYRAKALIGVVTKVVEVVFECLTPLVIARMVDDGVRRGDTAEVVRLGVVLLVFAVVSYGFTLVCQKMAALASQGLGTDLRDALFRHVGELSATEVERFGTASLVTRVTSDVNQVQLALALSIRLLTRWPLLAVGSVVACLMIDPRLGLVTLVCTPLVGLVFYLVMSRVLPYYQQMRAQLDRVSLVTREGLSGARVIRAFRREAHEEERFDDAARAQAATAISSGALSAFLAPATMVVMDLGIVAILWQGGGQVNLGDLSQGDAMAFINYMTSSMISVGYLAGLLVNLMRGQASARRILEVLDCSPSIRDGSPSDLPLPPWGERPAIALASVGFRYPGSARDALEGIAVTVPEGSTLGVIGGTGSGKSTLAELVPRLYDASEGAVSVLGKDVRDYPLAQLRHLASIVPQHAALVSGTIRSNLSWRRPGASDEELWHALELAQAADFVDACGGLDARVEAEGKNFSGGQRQRLTIARALVGDPRILVLDDAASALDFSTDARLRAALASLADRLTCVVVSQRVSAVMGADQILVLDRGRQVGLGTHRELLDGCEVYREICLSQLRPEEAGL